MQNYARCRRLAGRRATALDHRRPAFEFFLHLSGKLGRGTGLRIHVLRLTPPNPEAVPRLIISALGHRYMQYINRSYRRTGNPSDSRHKSSLIHTSSYFLTCMHYIELNQVRRRVYRNLFRSELDAAVAGNIRLALNQNQPLGDSPFYARAAQAAGARREACPHGRPRLVKIGCNGSLGGRFGGMGPETIRCAVAYRA